MQPLLVAVIFAWIFRKYLIKGLLRTFCEIAVEVTAPEKPKKTAAEILKEWWPLIPMAAYLAAVYLFIARYS